ncbi:lipopolysaccharide-induced tumor necrosis factor-alpha factor homolog [Brachyhypopomus gauderio]|uniref:lipopolysaccharide-induced tumor necrosis factor-alpha factor homolog n=1 Tax=Brachyhypopomus gauderio TaxID=698409 RepID=UPI00404168FC
MASAPPLEISGAAGYMAPPSYEETMTAGPQYPQYGPAPPPPVYSKTTQAPYPTQAYTQMYAAPAPCAPVTNPVVSVQTVYVQPGVVFGDLPVQAFCPVCVQSVQTRLEHSSGTMTWLTCAGLCIFGCIYGCCLIPFCVDSLKDVRHHCPSCNRIMGVYKRL